MRIQEFCVNMLLMIGSIIMVLFIIPEWTPESQGYGHRSAGLFPACVRSATRSSVERGASRFP